MFLWKKIVMEKAEDPTPQVSAGGKEKAIGVAGGKTTGA